MNSKASGILPNRIDYKELIRPYLKQWKWFVASLILALVLAFLYIRYTTPEFAVQGKVQILEDQGAATEMSAFRDLEILSGGNNKVEDEIEILNSRTNMIEVIRQLGLNIKVSALGNISNTELYRNPPFKVKFLIPDTLVYRSMGQFYIKILSATSFSLSEEEDAPTTIHSFGNTIDSSLGEFVLIPESTQMGSLKDREYKISINPIDFVAQNYKDKLLVSVTSEYSSIVTLKLNDAVEEKAVDIVNGLIDTYNNNAVQDRKAIADRTAEFINERIADIYGDLSTVDESAQDYKTERGITDVSSQSNLNLNVGAANQQELQDANIQLNIASSMESIVKGQEGYELLPANIGLSDQTIANTTARYNELVLERNRLLKSSNEKNPIIVNIDQQLNGLKRTLESSLNSMTNNLNLRVNNLSSQLSQINARIYAAPRNERALRDIARQQQTTEALYLYLLQKREESQISFASASPKSKVIDRAYGVSPFPVSPKKSIIMLASFMLGLALPFSLIYANELLDNKVHNKVKLEKLVGDIPVLAELPRVGRKDSMLVKSGERTVLAESLRILRTNLDYLIRTHKKPGAANLIFVTSSVPGEGKTFVASNLAMILANTGKKVLLIGADIRNPKIYQFYSGKDVDKLGRPYRNKENKGLTEYLVDRSLGYQDIISSMLVHNETVDVIYSGKIPPNPAELLMTERMEDLLKTVATHYDYVIVDTAPLMVVSDTLLISKFADQIVYVTRAGMTDLKVLEYPLKLSSEGKLSGLSFVVNGVKVSNLGYGGKYGYGYGKTTKKWWKL